MKQSRLMILDSLNLFVCFFFARWLFMNYLFSYSIEIFKFESDELLETVITGGLILVMTAFFFVLFRFSYLRKIKMNHLIFLYGLYFLLLIYLLFFKNIGLQGLELNPMTYFDGVAYGYWFEPVMNLVLFIPLGFLIKFSWKKFGFAFLGLLMVEVMQYVLHLGVFDVGDLLANLVSLLFGQGIRLILLRFGFRQWLV